MKRFTVCTIGRWGEVRDELHGGALRDEALHGESIA